MDIIILTGIIFLALILFVSEWLRVDVVALLIIASLIVTGILTPAEAVEGFSNVATLTVLFMFVISAALLRTGALSRIGVVFSRIFRKSYRFGLLIMMISIAAVSAFVNNTPVVALFIPLIIGAANEAKIPSGKLLIPLSFASIFGGMCTLIGTSTNVLVDGIARQKGLEGFQMFTLAPAGICLLLAGMLYMYFFGRRLLPDRETDKDSNFQLTDYVAEVELHEDSSSTNQPIGNAPLVTEAGIDILGVIRENEIFSLPSEDFILKAGDILKVRCNVDRLKKLQGFKILVRPKHNLGQETFGSEDTALVELVITSNSSFDGKTMQEVQFRERYQAIPLAIRNRENVVYEWLMNTILRAGDVVLIEIKKSRLMKLKEEEYKQKQPFLLITEYKSNYTNWKNFLIVIVCLVGVVLLSAFGILHVMGGALLASCIIILTGCIPVKEVYNVINWKVVVLLAGAISLGIAMEKTGLSLLVANQVVDFIGPLGPVAILSALYLLTSLMTEVVSNASAALIAPVAISIAERLEVAPTPFLVAVALAASASFMTPIGYQTNTLIYGAGAYKFKDFTKVGIGLNLLFWVLATFLIPFFYEF